VKEALVFRPRNLLLALGIVLVAIQVVPYGRDHANPPIEREPAWDSPRTRELAVRACFDCHSHETRWPWYASIAPVSWRLQGHVDEGREHLNFSALDRSREEPTEAAEEVAKGTMPPRDYLLVHPGARLTEAEKQELIRGFEATFGTAEGRGGRERGRGGEDAEDRHERAGGR
jgi:hypothetical protein